MLFWMSFPRFANKGYLLDGKDPDIQKEEMDESESKSKFVRGSCCRQTFMIYA